MGTAVEISDTPPSNTPLRCAPPVSGSSPVQRSCPLSHILLLLGLWLAIYGASLASPPLLDDADGTHAQAARAMLETGDLVTLHVDGVRYLEKAPLPYWIAALSVRLFGATSFAVHLPLGLTVLALAMLGYAWARRAFGSRAALYSSVFLLTSAGVFLFTRVFIPDALLSLLLALSLYAMLRALESNPQGDRRTQRTAAFYAYGMWVAVALAVLTKGLVALVFFLATALLFLAVTRGARPGALRRLRPFTGTVLLLAIAAPWHILAGLRNTGAAGGHGFFWFYFVNEHVLRFLGRRMPRDYNKLPAALYWCLHMVWLFPWSLFAPAAVLFAWRRRRELQGRRDSDQAGQRLSRLELLNARSSRAHWLRPELATFRGRTVLVLSLFSALVLGFFSLSTNQEYYTLPAYLPLLMLLAAALAGLERDSAVGRTPVPASVAGGSVRGSTAGLGPARSSAAYAVPDQRVRKTLAFSFASLAVLGVAAALALAYGLWSSRLLPFVPDIGAELAHRGVGDYTLSMSHFFDLTGPSFAALRLPASLAAIAFCLGPALAWMLYRRRCRTSRGSLLLAPLMTLALSFATVLVAAHIALVRFAPMLSSSSFAATIEALEHSGRVAPDSEVLIFGDQAFGSSLPFYLDRRVYLVDGRTTSMLFGSTFPDAAPIFLTHDQLLAQWGHGPRKLLFVPLEQRAAVDRLLGSQPIVLQETSGKALLTDRTLDASPSTERVDSAPSGAQP